MFEYHRRVGFFHVFGWAVTPETHELPGKVKAKRGLWDLPAKRARRMVGKV